MRALSRTAVPLVALAAVITLGGGVATADGGSGGGGGGQSGTWPAAYPLPLDPGTLVSQSSTTAVVRSTDTTTTVESKLDALYVTGLGCASRAAVNKPRDYLCFNAATRKTDEIVFTFAALDPTATDPSRSQSNAFYNKG
jgi:hypothetical protein